MSDVPFGFGPSDRDPDRDRDESGKGGEPGGPQDPFGFGNLPPGSGGGFPGIPGMPGGGGPGGFDMGQLGQMLSQLGQMLSSAQQTGPSDGPVNYDLAAQMATQQLAQKTSSLTDAQRTAVADAVKLAELWLDPATEFPAGASETVAWTPSDWVRASMPTWKRLCDPVARRVSGAWVDGLPEEIRSAAGPMLAMIGQMGGMAFGSQLGNGLGQLAAEVLTGSEIGFPVGPERTAVLMPESIEKFTEGLDRPASEVMIFLAAREAAHHRLFAHVPWLRERLLATVEDYARGITVDTSRIEDMARQIDPSNPASIQEAMQSGMFEPQTTPEQKAALARLETLLALIEGWVDAVVAEAVGERLPGADALRETLRRRRASGGPAEQAFASIVGLEMRPRKLRAAAELWKLLEEERGIEGRDALWAHPDLLPVSDDLDDPAGFVNRRDTDDPIAELEKQFAAEAEKQKADEAAAASQDAATNESTGSGDAAGEKSADADADGSGDGSRDDSGDDEGKGGAAPTV